MRVRFTKRASREVDAIFAHVGRENPRAARDIVDKIDDVARLLSEHPEAGRAALPDGLRLYPVPRLPYLVFYRLRAGEVQVLRVRHGWRRPLV